MNIAVIIAANLVKGDYMTKTTTEMEEYIHEYKEEAHEQKIDSIFSDCFALKKQQIGNIFSDYHHHDLYEILYIQTGKVIYSIENTKYTLCAGDVVFISPTLLHRLNDVITEPCERVILHFSERFINDLSTEQTDLLKIFKAMSKTKNYKLTIPNVYKNKINRLFEKMENIQFDMSYGSDITFKSSLSHLMLIFNNIYTNSSNENNLIIENDIVNDINQYITDNIDKKITILELANHVHLSPSRVQHIFKEETGTSIVKYINKKRLVKAKELLRGNEKIINIYEKCGFQDYTSFFRAFKNEYGITPKAYIATCEKKFIL